MMEAIFAFNIDQINVVILVAYPKSLDLDLVPTLDLELDNKWCWHSNGGLAVDAEEHVVECGSGI